MIVDDKTRRAELATFLRSRRTRLSPMDGGFPGGGRRRTPGLRREEVAQLAGIGTTWYTRLEQGLDIRVSAGTLEGIARALQLSPDEREHLFRLALQQSPAVAEIPDEALPPQLMNVLSGVSGAPAFIINYRWDVLAWNHLAQSVFIDFSVIPPGERNMLRIVFTHPQMRARLSEWEEFSQGILGQFRVVWGRYAGDRELEQLIQDLQQRSSEFRAWWPRYELRGRPESSKVINHPEAGKLVLQPSTFLVDGSAGTRMVIYTPDPETDTERRLRQLAGDRF